MHICVHTGVISLNTFLPGELLVSPHCPSPRSLEPTSGARLPELCTPTFLGISWSAPWRAELMTISSPGGQDRPSRVLMSFLPGMDDGDGTAADTVFSSPSERSPECQPSERLRPCLDSCPASWCPFPPLAPVCLSGPPGRPACPLALLLPLSPAPPRPGRLLPPAPSLLCRVRPATGRSFGAKGVKTHRFRIWRQDCF